MSRNYLIQIPTTKELYVKFYELHMQLRLSNKRGRWTLDNTLELLMNAYLSSRNVVKSY